MSLIYEKTKNKTQNALMRDSEPSNLKGCSVRLLPEYIQLIDKLAQKLDESRQTFLSSIIYDAVDEALSAYASVFDNPMDVYQQLRSECGFIYGNHTQSQFFEFCRLNNLHPDDPSSRDNFEMVLDHQEQLRELEGE